MNTSRNFSENIHAVLDEVFEESDQLLIDLCENCEFDESEESEIREEFQNGLKQELGLLSTLSDQLGDKRFLEIASQFRFDLTDVEHLRSYMFITAANRIVEFAETLVPEEDKAWLPYTDKLSAFSSHRLLMFSYMAGVASEMSRLEIDGKEEPEDFFEDN